MSKTKQSLVKGLQQALSGLGKDEASASNQSRTGKKKKQKTKRNRRKGRSLIDIGGGSHTGVAVAYDESLPPNVGKPTRHSQSHGGEVITNCELILPTLSFPASTGFAIESQLSINPGNNTIFSWLGLIAQSYQLYSVRRLDVYYIPIAGSSTQGNTLAAAYYNVNTVAPTNEKDMMAAWTKHTGVVWRGYKMSLDLMSMNSAGKKKVRQFTSGGDQNVYDCVKMFFGAVNAVDTSAKPYGKIFLDYEFEFFDPISPNNVSVAPSSTSLYVAAGQAVTTAVPTRVIFNAGDDPNNFGPQGTFNGRNNSWEPPPGWWLVTVCLTFSDSASETFSGVLQLIQGGNLMNGGLQSFKSPGIGSCAQSVTAQAIMYVSSFTDDFSVNITLTGAAGNLGVAQGGSITFAPA